MPRGKTIINELLNAMAQKPGKVLTADQIAKMTKNEVYRVRDSLTAYVRLHPTGPVERVSSGIFRWNDEVHAPVSAQPATDTTVGEYAREATVKDPYAWSADEVAKVREAQAYANTAAHTHASNNDELTAADGRETLPPGEYHVKFGDVPSLQVRRGGIAFPPALAPGLKMDDATVVHIGPDDGSLEGNRGVYFTWRGKMWKATTI